VTAGSYSKDLYFFSVGTIGRSTRDGRKPSTLLQAARHNRRAIQAELGADSHIDPERICLNETLAGPATPAEVVALAHSSMISAGVVVEKLRKDYAQAVEFLFSLSADTEVDIRDYFQRCVDWVGERFGAANILSADIHRDESVPHCHVLLLPLVDGMMHGSKLIVRPELAKLRVSFERDVARRFGLKKPVGRLTGATRGRAARLVLERLESTQDAVMKSALWLTTRRAIEHDPTPYLAVLGIDIQPDKSARKAKTMTDIFTSPGKGPKAEPFSRIVMDVYPGKPIGFAPRWASTAGGNNAATDPEKPIGLSGCHEGERNLSCVGFAPSSAVFLSPIPGEPMSLQGPEADDDYDYDDVAMAESDSTHDCEASTAAPRARWAHAANNSCQKKPTFPASCPCCLFHRECNPQCNLTALDF
jgi:hypothetical protein